MRLTLSNLLNIEPLSHAIKNRIDLDTIRVIDFNIDEMLVKILFEQSHKAPQSRVYYFKTLTAIENFLCDLYTIFVVRNNRASAAFDIQVRRSPRMMMLPVSINLKKEYHLGICLQSLMVYDLIGITDIDFDSLADIDFQSSSGTLRLKYYAGSEIEALEFDANASVVGFVEAAKQLMLAARK